MTGLSPSVLYELGFEPAVEWLTEQVRTKHGIAVKFESNLRTRRFDKDIQILLFQAVRELLINVVKHAKAIEASVSIRAFGDHLRITVRDDGVGFDVSRLDAGMDAEGGFGLFSLRERLQYFGGQLKITTRAGKGTSVTLEIPSKKSRKIQRRMKHVH
jgi:signal transduction histidine kinase